MWRDMSTVCLSIMDRLTARRRSSIQASSKKRQCCRHVNTASLPRSHVVGNTLAGVGRYHMRRVTSVGHCPRTYAAGMVMSCVGEPCRQVVVEFVSHRCRRKAKTSYATIIMASGGPATRRRMATVALLFRQPSASVGHVVNEGHLASQYARATAIMDILI